MKKMKKAISVFVSAVLLVIMLPVVPANAIPENTFSNEISAFVNFLNQSKDGYSNADILGYDVSDPNSWSGVTFDETNGAASGHITKIDLAFLSLYGELDVSGFSYLDELNLIFNDLTSLKLTGCTELKRLRLANNQSLAITDLSDCTALTSLELSGVPINGNLDVSAFTELSSLSALNCGLTGITFSNESNISNLYLSDNALSGALDLTALSLLSELEITNNKLTSLSAVLHRNSDSYTINLNTDGFAGGYVGAVFSNVWDSRTDSQIFTQICVANGEADVGFNGWYDNESLVSSSYSYTLSEPSSINYTAHFCQKTTNSYELSKLIDFFNISDESGVTNAEKAEININDISTWVYPGNEPYVRTDMNGNVSEINLVALDLSGILNLTNFTSLETLTVYSNRLDGLILTGCTALSEIFARQNAIYTLDLSCCPALYSIDIAENPLYDINVNNLSGLREVDLLETDFSSLNLTPLTNLEHLNINGSHLRSLSITFCDKTNDTPGEGLVSTIKCDNNCSLDIYVSAYDTSNISAVPNGFFAVSGWYNSTESLLPSYTTQNIEIAPEDFPSYLEARSTAATPSEYEINTISNFLSLADESGFSNASKLNGVSTDDAATWNFAKWTSDGATTRISELNFENCDLTGDLNVSDFSYLKKITAPNNALTGLCVNNCFALEEIDAFGNYSLGALDFTGLNNLHGVNISASGVTSINASGLNNLEWFDCSSNDNLSSVIITNCPNLWFLNAGWCSFLSNLDFSGCVSLKNLQLENSPLPEVLDLSRLNLEVLRLNGSFTEVKFNGNYLGNNVFCDFNTDPNSLITSLYFGTRWDEIAGGEIPCFTVTGDGTENYMFDSWNNDALNTVISSDETLDCSSLVSTGIINATVHSKTLQKDAGEIAAIDMFLSVSDGISTNAEKLGMTIGDISTWDNNITWTKSHITRIDFNSFFNEENSSMGTLDVSNFSKLAEVNLNNCRITSFNAANCPELRFVSIWNANLMSYDFTNSENVENLTLAMCGLTTFNGTPFPSLRSLCLNNNPLAFLNVADCTFLESLRIKDVMITGSLLLNETTLYEFFYSGTDNCYLDTLSFYYTSGITTIPVSITAETNAIIKSVSLGNDWSDESGTEEYFSTITGGAKIGYTFEKWTDRLTSADISERDIDILPYLQNDSVSFTVYARDSVPNFEETAAINEFLSVSDGAKTNAEKLGFSIGDPLSWASLIKWDGDNIVSINFNQESLSDDENRLTGELDVSRFSFLKTIDIHNTNITSLITDDCSELTDISAWFANLNAISFRNCNKLKNVNFWHNSVTSVEILGVPNISSFSCSENSLTSLDLSQLHLNYLDSVQNPLESITAFFPETNNAVTLIAKKGAFVSLAFDEYMGSFIANGGASDGNTFTGWSTTEDGNIISDEFSFALSPDVPVTLYANSIEYGANQYGGPTQIIRSTHVGETAEMLKRTIISANICDSNAIVSIRETEDGAEYTGNVKTGLLVYITNETETYNYVLSVAGDLDGDGLMSTDDYALIKEIVHRDTINGVFRTDLQLHAADFDNDGAVDAIDMFLFQRGL